MSLRSICRAPLLWVAPLRDYESLVYSTLAYEREDYCRIPVGMFNWIQLRRIDTCDLHLPPPPPPTTTHTHTHTPPRFRPPSLLCPPCPLSLQTFSFPADCTFRSSLADFHALQNGELRLTQAMSEGRVQVGGNARLLALLAPAMRICRQMRDEYVLCDGASLMRGRS